MERSRNLYEQLLAPLGLDGRIAEGTVPAPAASEPTITATWVLLVRRRSTMFRRFFASLRDALMSEETGVPAPLAAVVADEPSRLDLDRGLGDDSSWRHMAERLLMPLPTNPEQELVARRLAEHRGVTVQGPPGTGKTHTIANLISHLVGHGKRVLVTSQKEQALLVLRDKIPESIRDLSVAVLGTSAASLAQLDQSVQAIYEQAVGLDRAQARARIAALDSRLDELHRDIGALADPDQRLHRPRTRQLHRWYGHPQPVDARAVARRERRRPGIYPGRDRSVRYLPAVWDRDRRPVPAGQDRSTPPTAPRRACTCPSRNSWPRHRSWPLPPPSCATYVTAWPPPRASWRTVSRWSASAPTVLVTLIDTVERAAQPAGGAGTALAGGDPRRVADRRIRRNLAGSDEGLAGGNRGARRLARAPAGAFGRNPRRLAADRVPRAACSSYGTGWPPGRACRRPSRRTCTGSARHARWTRSHRAGAEDAELCIIEARSRRRRYELIRGWNGAVSRIAGPMIDPSTSHPEYLLHQYIGDIGAAFAWEDRAWYALRDRLRASGIRVSEQVTSADLSALAATLRTAALHITEKGPDRTAGYGPQVSRRWRVPSAG